jgi:hypothetical protein
MRGRSDHVHARRRRQIGVLRRSWTVVTRDHPIEPGIRQQVKQLTVLVATARASRLSTFAVSGSVDGLSERKQVHREEDVEELQRIARRLAER